MNKLAPAKTARIIEPDRKTWLANTRNDLLKIGFSTTGSLNLDRQLGLPNLPLEREMPGVIWGSDIPDECQVCGNPIDDKFVDGVVKNGGFWANMCVSCHKENGIGLGTGRGQLYVKSSDESFIKAEG